MKSLKTVLCFCLYSLCSFAYAQQNYPEIEPQLPMSGWQQLLNGHDLNDWRFVGLGDFAIQDGAVMSRGKMGIMWYQPQKFGNCVVRVVYKVSDPGTSSAVFVLIPKPPKDVWYAVNHGYQIKISDIGDPYHRTGSVYSLSYTKDGLTKPVGQWNTMDIYLQHQSITVYINGKLATHYTPSQTVPPKTASSEPDRGNSMADSGYIGLQNHNDLINEVVAQAWFKEVSVLPLSSSKQISS